MSLIDIDLLAIAHDLKEVAHQKIMPLFRNLDQSDIETKKDGDPVCKADFFGEEALERRFSDRFPGCYIVGEEACSKDPGVLAKIPDDRISVFLDALDGTHNFIAGRADFATMAAVAIGGETVASWIYFPNTDEMLMASRGTGVLLNGERVRLAADNPATPMLGLVSSRLKPVMKTDAFAKVAALLYPLEIGGPVSGMYRRLFTNGSTSPRATFLLFGKAFPWDHLPGLFLVAEAGGTSINLREGKPYDRQSQKGLLVAHDRETLMRLYGTIEEIKDILTNGLPLNDACVSCKSTSSA